jgi:peptide/nickel transport system permease protein
MSEAPATPRTTAPRFWRFARQRPSMLFGLAVIVVTVALAFIGPTIAPYETEAPSGPSLAPPSAEHWFGTDVSGLDILSRVLAAPPVDLTIALVSTTIAFALGIALGVISGFFAGQAGLGSWVSAAIMRGADVLQAFPVFVFALALVGFSGPSVKNVIAALAFLNTPFFLRFTRGAVLQVRSRSFVEAAICAGNSSLRTAFVHVMPNSIAPALVHFSTTVGFAILLTAGLSFVGAGIAPPTPELGLMIQVGAQNMMTGQWWTALFPGLALGVTVVGYALFGDNLSVFLDPVSRRET